MPGQSLRNWTWKELKVDDVGKFEYTKEVSIFRSTR